MNSFRSLVYLTVGANATRVFCRGSGLVQGDFVPAIGFQPARVVAADPPRGQSSKCQPASIRR